MIPREALGLVNDFIEERTGITIPESTYPALDSYLKDRLGGELNGLGGYLQRARSDHNEYSGLVEAVTINETYFFREQKHFFCLRDDILPRLAAGGRVNIWSSSCSSGEEPLSIYALASDIPGLDFKLFASDINPVMLSRFREGRYGKGAFRTDGGVLNPLIRKISDELPEGGAVFSPELLSRIKIFEHNLFGGDYSALPEMDVIFLRNTLIYMSPDHKRNVIDRLADRLKTGGCLFLSAVEMPLISHPALSVREGGGLYYFQKEDPRRLSRSALEHKIAATPSLRAGRAAEAGGAGGAGGATAASASASEGESQIKRQEAAAIPYGRPMACFEDGVCEAVALQLNNETAKTEDRQTEEAAALILKLLKLTAANDSASAAELLSGGASGQWIVIPSLRAFFIAGLKQREGRRTEAEFYYRRALESNPGLWPAKFFLAKLLPGSHPDLPRLVDELKDDIEDYISAHRFDYQFLLDGFNARYFQLICEKMRQGRGG